MIATATRPLCAMPYTTKVDSVWGPRCSEHGYDHRVMCPGCSGPKPPDSVPAAAQPAEDRLLRGMPYTTKVDPTWGPRCSEHGYGHRVMCPGCSSTAAA